MNEAREKQPWQRRRQGLAGHSPALARLFLVGLRPRRARLRFTGRNNYRASGDEFPKNTTRKRGGEDDGCIGPSLGKRPS